MQLIKSISSVHTDFGVESGIAQTPAIPLQEILPHWTRPSDATPFQEECFLDPEVPLHIEDGNQFIPEREASAQHLVDLTGSLEGPDMMHILHNATNELAAVAESYPDMLRKLTLLCKMMSNKETKQQLLTNCFSEGDAFAFYEQVAEVSQTVNEQLWNTIAAAIELVAELEVALKTGWSLEGFMRGGKPPQSNSQDGSPDFGVNLREIDEAVLSDFFWGSIKVFLQVARVQREAVNFVNSCSCHYGLPRADVDKDVRDLWDSCPMRGRRCPELVGGDFFTMLQCFLQTCSVSLEMQLPSSLSSEERIKLLRDFELSKQELLTTYVVKLSFWRQAPFAVVGLAHADPAVRTKSLVTCLNSNSQHSKVQLLKRHEDICRAFLVGGGLWDESSSHGHGFSVLKELAMGYGSQAFLCIRVEG